MRLIAAAVLLSASSAWAAPATVPQGVTLVEVVRELSSSQPEFLWMRPGDPDGRTLFTSAKDAPGVSNCTAACAQEWIPFAVNGKPLGDWTTIKRADGKQQWAYRGQPLYTWVKEEVPGDVATTVGVKEVFNSKLAENARKLGELEPPADWKIARFDASANRAVPDGVDIRIVAGAQGVILTDHAGLSLYAFDGDAKKDGQLCSSSGCNVTWIPVTAPALAANVGDFSLVARSDGTQQWAWQKKPLYRFKNDKLPGDVHGAGVDKKWSLALISETFRPAGVDIAFHEGYGDALTVNGMTLYTGIAYEKRWGGRNLRDNYRNAYYRGKKLAGNTCLTTDCLARWKPFTAPATAVAHGFWEPIAREDGSKQWSYKGYALYTFAGDKAPGDMNGNDAYDIADYNDVSDETYKRASLLVEVNGVSSVYWHIAKP